MMRPGITMRDPLWFFMPLIFTAELMMISHSIIHAFLARLEDPTVTLAAFSISFILHSTLGSPIWTGPQVAISYISDKRSIVRLFWFHVQAGVVPTAVMLVVAWSPVGEWLYAGLMGAGPKASAQAQAATLYFTFVFLVVPFRNISAGLIMVNRRTMLITLGTAVRLGSLGLFLYGLPFWLEGASVGAAALFLCIAVESVFSVLMAVHFYRALPDDKGETPSYWEMWRFSWPLMVNQTAESAVFFAINLFLGRLANADLALASFGVMRGILMVLLSPLRNLAQTAQTLTRTREDMRVMLCFSVWTIAFFALAVLVVFSTPLRWWVLDVVMGLRPELSAYTAPSLLLAYVVAVAWGFSSLLKGLVTALRRTGSLAVTAAVRLAVVIAMGSLTLADPDINGAVVGIIAFAGAFGAEAVMLGWQFLFSRSAGKLFAAVEVGSSGKAD
jgi:Na+-driven multidrug efflux pump